MPIEAIAAAITAIANMITEIVKGQPPEVKQKLWEWYIGDIKATREMFGMKT